MSLVVILIPLILAIFNTTSGNANQLIQISTWGFSPKNITIDQGTTVEFKNVSNTDHWPASNIHPTHDIYPEFDPQKAIKPQRSWKFTFTKAGEWRFHDHINPLLVGTVFVKNSQMPLVLMLSLQAKRSVKQVENFFSDIRDIFIICYFKIFPEDLEGYYLPRHSLAEIVDGKRDNLLAFIVRRIGPEKAIEKLYRESKQGNRFNCHRPAHTIGNVSYQLFGEKGLEKDIKLCNYGYLDGFTEAFVKDKGADNLAANFDDLCKRAKSAVGNIICYHGSGHGLMAFSSNDLPYAISGCSKFNTNLQQSKCLEGAFMENVDSGVNGKSSIHPTKWLSQTDPFFPCNSIDQKPIIQKACYSVQTQWMKELYRNDYDRVARECFSLYDPLTSYCFYGLGQDIAIGTPKSDQATVVAGCNKLLQYQSYFEQCINGAQGILMDGSPTMESRVRNFCSLLPAPNEDRCMQLLEIRLKRAAPG